MIVPKHQKKVLFSSLTIVAALVYSLIGWSVLADDVTVTRDGDNITIQSNQWAQNRFYVGEILAGDMGNIEVTTETDSSVNTSVQTSVHTSVNSSSDLPTTDMDTAEILGEILGNNSEPQMPVTTVWQESTWAHWMTGIDDIPYDPAYTWAREYGLTNAVPTAAYMDAPILRYEFAMMMMAYIQNVEGKTLAENSKCDIWRYADYNTMNATVRDVVQKACDTGLMWRQSQVGNNDQITELLPRFRPYDQLSKDELLIVANRYVPTIIRIFPTNNTRSAAIRFLYTIAPQEPTQ